MSLIEPPRPSMWLFFKSLLSLFLILSNLHAADGDLFLLQERGLNEIQTAWSIRQRAKSLGQTKIELKQLDEILFLKEKYSIPSLPFLAKTLAQESIIGDTKLEKRKLIEYVKSFQNTGSPLSSYIICNINPLNIGICLDGFIKQISRSNSALTILTNIIFLLIYAMIALSIIFLSLSFLLNLEPTLEFWSYFFPNLKKEGNLILHLFFSSLSWLAFGWLGLFVFGMIILNQKLTRFENYFFIFICIFFLSLPWALKIPSMKITADNDILNIIEDPLGGINIYQNEKTLENWIVDFPEDREALFSLAIIKSRLGYFSDAKKIYQKSLSKITNWEPAQHNLAVIEYNLGNHDIAVNLLEELTRKNSKSPYVHFNLGKIYLQKTLIQKGRYHLDEAKKASPSLLTNLQEKSKQNAFLGTLVEQPLSRSEIYSRIISKQKKLGPSNFSLYRTIFPQFSYLLTTIILILLLVSRVIIIYLGFERETETKKLIANTRDFKLFDEAYHKTILEKFLSSTFWTTFKSHWISFILPGSHLFFQEKFSKGITIMSLFIIVVIPLILPNLFLKDASLQPVIQGFPIYLPLMVIASTIYLISTFQVLRQV